MSRENAKVQEFNSKKVKVYSCGGGKRLADIGGHHGPYCEKNSPYLYTAYYMSPTKTIINGKGDELYAAKGTIQEVVEEAVKMGANLRGAELDRVPLDGRYLKRARLGEASLRFANLKGANLEWANFIKANLEWANLRGANLELADFEGANLKGVDLTKIKDYKKTIGTIKNLDKAENVDPKALADWKKANDSSKSKVGLLKSKEGR